MISGTVNCQEQDLGIVVDSGGEKHQLNVWWLYGNHLLGIIRERVENKQILCLYKYIVHQLCENLVLFWCLSHLRSLILEFNIFEERK